MKKLSVITLSLLLSAAMPAWSDDFGARFGGISTTALEDTPSDAMANDLQNITPAAGDASVDIEAEADAEMNAEPKPIPAEPEATQQEKTESSIINYDQGMSPDKAEDPSYRLQDSTN
ncbi:MAG: hypothetical protein ACT4OY_01100 [Alphaproteobacteria bacterium]